MSMLNQNVEKKHKFETVVDNSKRTDVLEANREHEQFWRIDSIGSVVNARNVQASSQWADFVLVPAISSFNYFLITKFDIII